MEKHKKEKKELGEIQRRINKVSQTDEEDDLFRKEMEREFEKEENDDGEENTEGGVCVGCKKKEEEEV